MTRFQGKLTIIDFINVKMAFSFDEGRDSPMGLDVALEVINHLQEVDLTTNSRAVCNNEGKEKFIATYRTLDISRNPKYSNYISKHFQAA